MSTNRRSVAKKGGKKAEAKSPGPIDNPKDKMPPGIRRSVRARQKESLAECKLFNQFLDAKAETADELRRRNHALEQIVKALGIQEACAELRSIALGRKKRANKARKAAQGRALD